MHAMTDRTDFSDLLRRRRAELGLSLRDMEARSVHGEVRAKFGWLSKLERGLPVDTPKENLLKALSAGYELPERILKEAAAVQFLGYDPETSSGVVWSDDLSTRIIVARAEEMSEEDRQQLAEIAESFARRRAQRKGSGQDKPED